MKQLYQLGKSSKTILSIVMFSLINLININGQAPSNPNNPNNLPYIPNRGCGTGILPQQFEAWLQNITPTTTRLGGGQTQSVYNIPVIVHVIHNNEALNSATATTGGNLNAAQIQSQINILNADFNGLNADTNLIPTAFKPFKGNFQFNFCLAVVNPTGGVLAEPGIDRINRTTRTPTWTAPPYSMTYIDNTIKPATIWNPTKYMNMWVCGISGGILGYATFPNPGTSGLSGLSAPYGTTSTDGLVMLNTAFGSVGTAISGAPYNKGRTATHEIGHWLGLRHIWGDNGQCGATDYCNDTPPQQGGTVTPAGSNYGCPTFPFNANTCTLSTQSNPNGDMFMNYMDYTNDACMYMFTNDQKTRAQLIMTNSPLRLGLLTSTVCNAPTVINDIGILYVSNPTFSQNITCSTSINPSVAIFNFGTNTISSASFSYNINGIGTQTIAWSGNLAPSNSLIVAMPTINGLTNGNHAYNIGVYSPNGTTDPNLNNNVSNQPFTIANAYNFTMNATSSTVCPNNNTVVIGVSGGNSFTLQPGNLTALGSNTAFMVFPSATTVYTVLANNGICTVSQNYTAFVNSIGSLSVSSNQTICTGGNVTLTASGLSTYTWNTGSNFASIVVSPTTTTIYTVSGTSGSCINTNTISVVVNSSLAINVNSLALCAGQTGTLFANGATNYSWTTGATSSSIVISPSINTTYSVLGNSGSCFGGNQITVTVTPLPVITASASPGNICAGSSALIFPSGACTFTYSSGSATVTPTISTIYTVTGTSCTGGCISTGTVSVNVTQPSPITINPSSAIICPGNSLVLTAGGASTYSWNNGANTSSIMVSPSVTTNYSVSGLGGVCTNSGIVSVTVATLPNITVNSQTICAGGAATLIANGATTYTWSNGSTNSTSIVTPTANTSYSVLGSNGTCTNTQNATVSIGSALSIFVTAPIGICTGNSATLNATGANTYSWSNGSTGSSIVVNPTTTITYSVIGTNGSCTGSTAITVSVGVPPSVNITSSPTVPICAGATATLNASGASSYTWSTGANGSQVLVNPTSNTIYTVTGSINGCTNTATVSVNTTTAAISLSLNASASNICAGNQATLYVTGANSYSWSTGSTNFSIVVSPTATTIYTVLGSNGACQGTASNTINIIPVSPINISASPSFSVCAGRSILLSASGTFTSYTWSNSSSNASSISITPSASANYTVTAGGTSVSCISKTVVSVVVKTNPVSSLSITGASCGNSCNGKLNASSIGGISPYTYSLSGSTCSTLPCSNLCVGLYTLITIDSAGCSNFNIFSISNAQNNLIANITATHAACSNCNTGILSVTPSGGVAPYTYTWTPNVGTTAIVGGLSTGCYTVTINDAGGCTTKSWACIGIGTSVDGIIIYTSDFLLFPNPTKSQLNIQLQGYTFNYHVYSSLGQLIANENNVINATTVNVESFAKGIYLVEINVGDAVIRSKIVKE